MSQIGDFKSISKIISQILLTSTEADCKEQGSILEPLLFLIYANDMLRL